MSDSKWRYKQNSRAIEFTIACPFCRARVSDNTRSKCKTILFEHIVGNHLDQAFRAIVDSGGEDAMFAKRKIIEILMFERGRWLTEPKGETQKPAPPPAQSQQNDPFDEFPF